MTDRERGPRTQDSFWAPATPSGVCWAGWVTLISWLMRRARAMQPQAHGSPQNGALASDTIVVRFAVWGSARSLEIGCAGAAIRPGL